jgi:hypothetical protein
MNLFENDALYALLRMALDPECSPSFFPYKLNDAEWNVLHSECLRQRIVGIAYRAISHLPKNQCPPLGLVFQWASEAETIRGHNKLLYEETATLTQLFDERNRKTAVLKGPANARLYPDLFMRQVGDIDLWVDGNRKDVVSLLRDMKFDIDDDGMLSTHHVQSHLENSNISVEFHYKPSSENDNPFTGSRMLLYLKQKILIAERVREGFYVPSIEFALVMQLAHIQWHFLENGIGLKQLVDYYILLRHSTQKNRLEVSSKLKSFGLWKICGAVMWVMEHVFGLVPEKMLAKPDECRGKILLAEINAGGYFGMDLQKQNDSHYFVSWLKRRARTVRLFPFDPVNVFWHEIGYWRAFVRYIPCRIKKQRISVRLL